MEKFSKTIIQKQEASIIQEWTENSVDIKLTMWGMKLSKRLYHNAKEVSAKTQGIINRAIKENKTIAEISKLLYEGYNFKIDPLHVKQKNTIPKWLKRELEKEPEERSFAQASSIKTPALKAAYTKALKTKSFNMQEQELKRAFYEKSRYYANRIAQNEVMKAYSVKRAKMLLENDDVAVVRVHMSQTHPRVDICDYHSKVDKFGLGKGVYPKKLAPIPPYHPHCRCSLLEISMSDKSAKYNPKADRELMDTFNNYERSLIVGSKRRLDMFLKSGDVLKNSVIGFPAYVKDVSEIKALGYNGGMENIQDKIIARFKNEEDDIYGNFATLWQSADSFEQHIAKRVSLSHVVNKNDYIYKTLLCLASSKDYVLAEHNKSWDNICYNSNKDWAVVFNEHGQIMTSYKIEETSLDFEAKHKKYNAKITKGRTDEKFRKYFNSIRK